MKNFIILIMVAFIAFLEVFGQTSILPQMIFRHDFTFDDNSNRDNIFPALFQDNGYILAGSKALSINFQYLWQHAHICKLSPSGDVVWEISDIDSTYSGTNSIAKAPVGGVFWAVSAVDGYGSGETPAVYRIDQDGNILWKKVLGKNLPYDGIIKAIAADDNFLIVAQGKYNQKISIFDLAGNLLIDSWYFPLESISGLIIKDSSLYISGINSGGIMINYHAEVYKTDLYGNIIWADTLQDMVNPWTVIDGNGDLYLSGRQPTIPCWIRTIKYNKTSGQRVWEKYWNGDPPNQSTKDDCNPWFIIAHPQGGCVITGYLQKVGSTDANSTDAGIISYDSDSNERFKVRYDYEPSWFRTDFRAALFEDNILVTFGMAWENLDLGFEAQLYFAKWDNVTSLELETGVLPEKYYLFQNYPNPFNPTTVINFSLPQTGNVILKVFNLLGQEVETLIDEDLSIGNYSIQFNAQGIASGIYIYELRVGNFVEKKKMVLLK